MPGVTVVAVMVARVQADSLDRLEADPDRSEHVIATASRTLLAAWSLAVGEGPALGPASDALAEWLEALEDAGGATTTDVPPPGRAEARSGV